MTARDFLLAEHLHHTSILDVHYASRIGLTTLKELVAGRRGVSVAGANRLQTWSLSLGGSAYISAAMTVGVLLPVDAGVARLAEALGRPGASIEECIALITGSTR